MIKIVISFISILVLSIFAVTCTSQNGTIDVKQEPHYVRKNLNPDSDSGSVLILLHGYGSNEDDLLGLKQMFPSSGCVISFRAPIEIGRGAFCWFPIQGHDGGAQVDTTQYYQSGTLLMRWIEATLEKEKLQGRKLFIAGFSQGAMMSYEMVRRYADRFDGVIGFSGSDKALKHLSPASNCGADILMTHGKADQVLMYDSGQEAKKMLEKCGANVEFYSFDGGHQIPSSVVYKAADWLRLRW
jgi:phospholipase/carboxylesterase